VIRFERHRLGPRVYVCGRRIHEFELGFSVLAVALALTLLGHRLAAGIAAVVGVWLVAKDWRDLFPASRDTACWRLGLHRQLASLRARRRGEWLPPLAAAAAIAAGLVNLESALTPNLAWRGHVLRLLEPVKAIPLFHALAVPASGILIVAGVYLARRRRRAWAVAIAFLLALAAFDLLKGLDVEEAALSCAVAGMLWWGRDSFHVHHAPIRVRSGVWRALAAWGCVAALAAATAAVAAPAHAGTRLVGRETVDLLLWSEGPVRFHDELALLPLAIGLAGVATLLATIYLVFRPLAAPGALPTPELRRTAAELVRTHGADTLSFFKLRRDKQYLFSPDGRAFLGYRVENGVLLVSGDPVGPPELLPALATEACSFAELRGLKLGVLGASAQMLPLWSEAGLRSLYIGDEAIVDTGAFSLEGRPIRKVRQSVTRLRTAGYAVSASALGSLEAASLAELERISAAWRQGAGERGFSMAMDGLDPREHAESMVVVARDADGVARGFLHFVPTYGRAAMSLSLMRRERDTPNGLTEFMVVGAIELLRDLGIDELSLNFAAFARLLHSPRGNVEHWLGRCVSLGNRYFQIESLYRFNAKFFPRWQPRYLLYESALALPRTGMAALWAEGQLPKPSLR
jgi:lysyl-tRNA synthetase class 2